MIDNYGVVILSSREDWRFHASRPLSAAGATRSTPTSLPGAGPEAPAPATERLAQPEPDATGNRLDGEHLRPRTLIERPVRSVLLIGGATLLALLLLLTLLTLSRRHYLDRIALEAEAKRQLEERVLERTRELENANAQLQQEVHEREQAQRELMRAQDEVVQAGKLTALGTMSASISHELNQPLAAIRSYADNARVLLDHQRTGTPAAISSRSATSPPAWPRSSPTSRPMPAVRRAPENVRLQPAIEDALSMVASRRRAMNVELLRDVPDAPLWVQAGETRLRQILGNLLTNALDALAEPRRLWVIASQDQHGVTLTLRDNGPGFSEDALAHAHEPFSPPRPPPKGSASAITYCAPSAAAWKWATISKAAPWCACTAAGSSRRRRHAQEETRA